MRPKVLILTPRSWQATSMTDEACQLLSEFADVRRNEGARPLTVEEKRSMLPGVQAVVCAGAAGLAPEDFAAADELRLIGVLGHSVRGVSPEAALARGITIVNTAAAHGWSVAEMALGLMLCCLREIPLLDRRMRAGEWQESRRQTSDLVGRTVGLLGLGAVARQLITLLVPFRPTILGHDPYVAEADLAELPLPVRLVGLDEMLRSVDVLSIHAGMTDETRHLLGARELGLLRDGAVIVNTARGGIIDQDALVERLAAGTLGAGLDVYAAEPLPASSPLRRLENVVLTPHAGGMTAQMYRRRALSIAHDIRRFFAGEPLPHALTLDQIRRHSS